MSEHFLKFKKAFHQSMPQMPQMKFPTFPKQMFGGIQHSKWIQLFSSGIILYSVYYYLKRTSKHNRIQHSFFSYMHCVKKLFLRSITTTYGSSREKKETQKNIALEVKELPEHVKYDNGWFDELDELKKLLTLTSASTSVFGDDALLAPLRETTPRGEIVMYYDAETKSFNYYSNSKNIPYSTLDAVARKYVCLYNVPSIYIDIRDEVQKGREKLLKKDKDNKSKLERSKDNNNTNSGIISSAKKSLFAAFKNYKTGRNAPKSLHNYNGKVKIDVFDAFDVIKDNINKCMYKGTLEQYDVDVKYYKNKQPSDFLKVVELNHDDADHDKNVDNIYNDNNDDMKLNREKEALSYADFKKKYNQ